MKIKIKQDEEYTGRDWWNWSVWLDGKDLQRVERVVWRLHPTFPEPVREVADKKTKFRLETAGWGGFIVKADVIMRDGTKERLQHELELHYPEGTVTTE